MPVASVPTPSDRRIAVRVAPAALRAIRRGHPWIFDGAIRNVSHEGNPGDLAVVFDDDRRFAAIGIWDPHSPIRIRILHAGEPTTIDDTFFADRLGAALTRRAPLVEDAATTGYRIVNGESDGFGGLVVDRYADTAVAKLYSSAWLARLPLVIELCSSLPSVEHVVLRLSRAVAATDTFGLKDGDVVAGRVPLDHVEFLEAGIRFGADVRRGHKTGHFLDQRDNRIAVARDAGGKRVLDVFCATGGFTVHAAAAGAAAVHSIDVSAPAIDTAVANLARNHDRIDNVEHTVEVADAFDALDRHARSGRRWDVVVIDPPSMAQRSDRRHHARRAYRRLVEAGVAVTEPGGLLVQSSCSSRVSADEFHALVAATAAGSGRATSEIRRTGHALDHPATFPEAEYLKTQYVRVLG